MNLKKLIIYLTIIYLVSQIFLNLKIFEKWQKKGKQKGVKV